MVIASKIDESRDLFRAKIQSNIYCDLADSLQML